MIQLAQAAADVAQVAAPTEGMPTWLQALLAVLAFLTTTGLAAALVKLINAKATSLERDALRDALCAHADDETRAKVDEHVKRATQRLEEKP